jgi:hypothetical protein
VPVVGVVGDEKTFTEQARRPELGGRVRRCFAGLLEPADALSKPALRPPEVGEAGRKLQRCPGIDSQEALERDASVVLVAAEYLEVDPLRPGECRRGFLQSNTEVEARVAFTDGVKLADGDELLGGVLADRLEQLVLAAAALLQQEGLLDEHGGEACDLRRGLAVAPADLLDRCQVEPAGEHCHPPQKVPLLLGEQGVAPFHRDAEGPLRTVGPSCRLRENRRTDGLASISARLASRPTTGSGASL